MENKENTNSGKLKIITSPTSQSNIEQAFGKYDFNITDEQVEMLVRAAYTSFCVEESGDVYLLDNEEDDFLGDANG